MERYCLLIDNEKQDTSIEKINRTGKARGLNITTIQFNVGDTELNEVLDAEKKIDIQKVIEYYKINFKKYHFDLVAFDWNLDDPIDGIELIRQLRHAGLFKKTQLVLYSGDLKDSVKGYFDEYNKDQGTFKDNWKRINTLIDAPIIGFFDRTNYEEKIVEALQQANKHFNFENYLIQKLRENGDLIFNNINPNFEGMSFDQIAETIEKENAQNQKFSTDLIEQLLAYLVQINPR